jgi:putative nucleotidyltransferase with HDIG domain
MLFSGVLTGLVTIIALKSRNRIGAAPLAMIMSMVTLWSFSYAGELLSTSTNWILFWEKIQYIWIVSVPPAWLYFSLSLNPWEKLKNKKILNLTFIVPVLVLLFVWTNESHHLFWTRHQLISVHGIRLMKNSFGPVFWVHFGYSYMMTIIGTGLLFYLFLVSEAISRHRFIFLLIPVFPLLANFLLFININPFEYLDPTPLGFTISGLMILWGGTRRFQLEVIPIAREVIMDNIEDGLIILDYSAEVIGANPATFRITGFKTMGQIQAFLMDGFVEPGKNSGPSQTELNGILHCPHVLLRLTPIYGKKRMAGWVAMLTDITRSKQLARELEESKERYETIFRGMRDAIIVRNPAGQILDANSTAGEMFGYSRVELLEKTTDDLILKSGNSSGIHSSAEFFRVEIHEWPIFISGEMVYLMVVRDITARVKAESDLKSRERYLQLLNNITWDGLAGQDVPEILQTFTDRLGELFESCGVFITLWDGTQPNIIPGAAFGPMRSIFPNLGAQPAKNTITQRVLESGHPIIIADIYQSSYLSTEVSLFFPARSLMVLPLIAGDRKFGAVFVTFDGIHHFNGEDLTRGAQTADQVALSISRAYLMEETRSLLSETQILNETLEYKVQERTGQLLAANRILEDEVEERQRSEAEIRNRLEVEHLISNLSFRFMESENFYPVIMDALKAIGYITGGIRVSMFLFRPGGTLADNTHEWCAAGEESRQEKLQSLPVTNLSWWLQQLQNNQQIQIRDRTGISPEAKTQLQVLEAGDIDSLLCYPISFDFKLAGFLKIDNPKFTGPFSEEDMGLISVLSRTISSALYRRMSQEQLKRANEELLSAYDATIEGWAKALELREKETEGHIERTLFLTLVLAEKLQVGPEQMDHIRRGALLHDIGKMVVPDHILQKMGPLTEDEWKIIREHPLYSMKMLSHIEFLKSSLAIPFYHHEKWDGSGYPFGLKGDEIPLAARIFALVDVWDALCSERPYREAYGWEEALIIVEKGVGTHFDPVTGRVFLAMIREGELS